MTKKQEVGKVDIQKVEEYFEKLRPVLYLLDMGNVPKNERDALAWIARDYLEKLGDVIGITAKI